MSTDSRISPLTTPQLYRLPLEEAPAPVTEPVADTGTQSADVRAAVDDVLPPGATAQQRQAAYEELQGYVDRAAQGGDYEAIDDASMRVLAVDVLQLAGITTRYSPEVVAAVQRELSSSATPEQTLQAYDEIQRYVDTVGGIGDAGITAEALPGRAATLLEEAGLPTVAAEARAEAERILEVGVRDNWLPGNQEDDYGARFDAFTEAMAGQSDAYREHLVAALLERDPGALKSWLTVDRVVSAADSGELTADAFASVTETVAAAYNDGTIDRDSFRGLYGIDDAETQMREYAQLQRFLGASDGDETAALRGKLASDILAEWDASPYPTDSGYHQYNLRQLTLAIELAAGDPSRPEILTDLLRGLDQQTFDKVIAIGAQLPDAPTDLMATIFETVSHDTRPVAGEFAARLARLPGEHSDWFAQDQVARNEALTAMLTAHRDAVLDELSEYDNSGARGLGEGETDRKQFEVNGRDLAAVLELTVFNPEIDAASRESARDAILQYSGEQAAIIDQSRSDPDSTGYLDASGRLVVLAAASDVAVDRGFEALQADRQAQKEAIAFVVDLALSAVPLSSRLQAAASGQIATLFEGNPLLTEALDGLTGQVIDSATGQLTDAAKEQLYAALDSDPELAALFERQTLADAFRDNILVAVADERDRAQIQNDASSLADDISELD